MLHFSLRRLVQSEKNGTRFSPNENCDLPIRTVVLSGLSFLLESRGRSPKRTLVVQETREIGRLRMETENF